MTSQSRNTTGSICINRSILCAIWKRYGFKAQVYIFYEKIHILE